MEFAWVIILTVSGGYQSQKMVGCVHFAHLGGDFDHGRIMRPVFTHQNCGLQSSILKVNNSTGSFLEAQLHAEFCARSLFATTRGSVGAVFRSGRVGASAASGIGLAIPRGVAPELRRISTSGAEVDLSGGKSQLSQTSSLVPRHVSSLLGMSGTCQHLARMSVCACYRFLTQQRLL